MGFVSRFDVSDLKRRYKCDYFVETGTGTGEALAHAADVQPPFIELRSCEIEHSLSNAAARRFAHNTRVRVITDRSSNFLRWVCRLVPANTHIFFWLDAHFPGADYGIRGYGDESDDTTRLPLAEELAVIARYRTGRDVVAIDDMRIYMDGPFGSGNLPDNLRAACPQRRDIDFIHEIMGHSHDIRVTYENEGYALLTPKESMRDA